MMCVLRLGSRASSLGLAAMEAYGRQWYSNVSQKLACDIRCEHVPSEWFVVCTRDCGRGRDRDRERGKDREGNT